MILREVTFFTSWGRYFEGIVTCLCYEHTLLFFIITIHARILSISCIKTIFNLSYASFSWQIIFVFICSILVYGAFAPCIYSSISNVRNGYILLCFSLIPWKVGLKVFILSYIIQMAQKHLWKSYGTNGAYKTVKDLSFIGLHVLFHLISQTLPLYFGKFQANSFSKLNTK